MDEREIKQDDIWKSGENTLTNKDHEIRCVEDEARALLAKGHEVDFPLINVFADPIIHEGSNYDRLHYPVRSRCGIHMEAETEFPYAKSLAEFSMQFTAASIGLDTLLWDLPVVAAGGSVLGALHLQPKVCVPDYAKRQFVLAKDVYSEFVDQHYRNSRVFRDKAFIDDKKRAPRPAVKGKTEKQTENEAHRMFDDIEANGNEIDKGRLRGYDSWEGLKSSGYFRRFKQLIPLWAQSKVPDDELHKNLMRKTGDMIGLMAFMSARCWHREIKSDLYYRRTQSWTIPLSNTDADDPVYGRDLRFDNISYPNCLLAPLCAIIKEYIGTDTDEVLAYQYPLGRTLRSFRASDIDLFLLTQDKEKAADTITIIYHRIRKVIPEWIKIKVCHSDNATTYVLPRPYRNIQIIHRLYQNIGHVLLGFDIDCCAIAYTGKAVYTTPRGLRALQTRQNIVDVTRQSTTYEARLFKYARRGFAVAAPGLDAKARFDEARNILVKEPLRCQGCGNLCRGCARTMRRKPFDYKWKGATKLVGMLMLAQKRLLWRVHPMRGTRLASDVFGVNDSLSDYHDNRPAHGKRNSDGRPKSPRDAIVEFDTDKSIEFSFTFAELSHIQGREKTLATGSFNPTKSDWYGGKDN